MGAFAAGLLMCAAGLWEHYNDAIAHGQRRVENLAFILSDHLRRSVEAVDATLAQLRVHSERVGGPNADAGAWKSVLEAALSGLTGVGLMKTGL